jgi:hypothetical protein
MGGNLHPSPNSSTFSCQGYHLQHFSRYTNETNRTSQLPQRCLTFTNGIMWKQFLSTNLTENHLKRIQKSVEAAVQKLMKLIFSHLILAAEAVVFRVCDARFVFSYISPSSIVYSRRSDVNTSFSIHLFTDSDNHVLSLLKGVSSE